MKTRAWIPHHAALGALMICSAAGAISERLLLGGHLDEDYFPRAIVHVGVGLALLSALAAVVYQTERRPLRDTFRRRRGVSTSSNLERKSD